MGKSLVLIVLLVFQLILAIHSSSFNRVMDRLKHLETRLNAESKFRDEDIASIIDRLDAIDKKLNDSLQVRGNINDDDPKANEKGSKEIELLKKDVDVIKKAFQREKFEATRMRREIPTIEEGLKMVKQDLEKYNTSMLNEIETIKEYAAHSDSLMKRGIFVQLNNLKMEQKAIRSKVNDTIVLVKETNTKVENNKMSVIELSRNVTRLLNDNTKVLVTERPKQVNIKLTNICVNLYKVGETSNGLYQIQNGIQVFCDQTTDGGGWMVFQRRQNGKVDFYRNWTEYKNGFGDLNGEFWLGNELLSKLTADGEHELRIEMDSPSHGLEYAKYSKFKISPEEEKYQLEVSGYDGEMGNDISMYDGMMFSTYDNDNDVLLSTNCAQIARGGWWYLNCKSIDFNGQSITSGSGKTWSELFRFGFINFIELKFR